jgi:hypothetical protein
MPSRKPLMAVVFQPAISGEGKKDLLSETTKFFILCDGNPM